MQKAIGLISPGFGLSYSQASALTVLASNERITQSEIASRLCLEPATVVTLIDELAKLKLVKRLLHDNDRRKYSITLTATGKELVKKIKSRSAKLEGFLHSKLTKKELAAMLSITDKLIEYLKEWKGGEK